MMLVIIEALGVCVACPGLLLSQKTGIFQRAFHQSLAWMLGRLAEGGILSVLAKSTTHPSGGSRTLHCRLWASRSGLGFTGLLLRNLLEVTIMRIYSK